MTTVAAEPIIYVVYVSSSVGILTDDQVLDILRVSRRNNERLGITGMLLYKDGNFMQVLEGTETAIRQVMTAITADPRHKGYLQLLKGSLEERQFPNWSMGFHNLSNLTGEDLKAFTPFLKVSFMDEEFRSQPGRAHKLLSNFRKSQR